VLEKHPTIYEGNKEVVVESLRSIAELMIWGDQHDSSFFDFFAEHQTLSHFHRILEQTKNNRFGEVAVQVLQTLSILIQNTRSEQAIYFLFSNNHINAIVSREFDIKNDEVLAYYVSFLKAIAMKLNKETVQFFFTYSANKRHFPLYTQALKFFNHEESMARAAVRTLTLQVYGIQDGEVQSFVVGGEAGEYFRDLGAHIAEQCANLCGIVSATGKGSIDPARLGAALDEVDDLVYYCNDIHSVGDAEVQNALIAGLVRTVGPQLFAPLAAVLGHKGCPRDLVNAPTDKADGYVQALVAVHALQRFFQHMQIAPVLDAFAAHLFLGAGGLEAVELHPSAALADGWGPAPAADGLFWTASDICYRSGDDRLTSACIMLLGAAIDCKGVSPAILTAARLRTVGGRGAGGGEGGGEPGAGPEGDEAPQRSPAGDGDLEAGEGPTFLGTGDDERVSLAQVLVPLCRRKLHPQILCQIGTILDRLIPRGAGSRIGEREVKVLEDAYTEAWTLFTAEIGGPWSDGLPLLFAKAWEAFAQSARDAHRVLDLAVLNLATAFTMPVIADGEVAKRTSAAAAQQANSTADRVASVLGIHRLLTQPEASFDSPLGAAAPSVSLPADAALGEVQEGDDIGLEGASAVPAKVAFSQGVEKKVAFVCQGHISKAVNRVNGSPSVLLVEPSEVNPNVGSVLAMAPMAGAEPAVDPSHSHWLHFRVRPPLNALVLSGKKERGKVRHMDGRWTLAFYDGKSSSRAKDLVEEKRQLLRQTSAAMLAPLDPAKALKLAA